MAIIALTFMIFIVAITAMALGVIVNKDKTKGELRGSCGGPQFNPECCMNKQECSDPSFCK